MIPEGWKVSRYQMRVGEALYHVEDFGTGTWFVTVFPNYGSGCFKNTLVHHGGFSSAADAMGAANAHAHAVARALCGPVNIDADGRPVEAP